MQDLRQAADCPYKLRLIIDAHDAPTARKSQWFDDARVVQLAGKGLNVIIQPAARPAR